MSQIVPANEKFFAIKKLVSDPETLDNLRRALPSHITAEKMSRVFLTAITTTPKLLDCEPASLMKAVMEASSLGLLPDGVLGHGYILPYGKSAKFIPGYRGLIDLARRSGKIAWIQARVVYEGDDFSYGYGADPFLTHVPARAVGAEPGKFHAVYAAAKFTESGEVAFEVMYDDDVEKIRKRSRAGESGPWVTDFEEMARKTVVRKLMKYLPLSPDVQAAVTADEYAERGLLHKLLEERVDPETGEVDVEEPKSTLEDLVVDAEAVEEEPSFEGSGRISSDEDNQFQQAVDGLASRLAEAIGQQAAERTTYDLLGQSGFESVTEIRSRKDREEFYHFLREKVEEAEKLA